MTHEQQKLDLKSPGAQQEERKKLSKCASSFFFPLLLPLHSLACKMRKKKKKKKHCGKADPYLVHSSPCAQSTLISLKAFQPGGDVTAEQ